MAAELVPHAQQLVHEAGGAFYLKSKNLFFTYPQCPVDKAVIVGNILDISLLLFPTNPLLYYTACNEHHADGSPHVHVVLSYERSVSIRNPRAYDFIDDEDIPFRLYHPSFNGCRSLQHSLNYCAKEDPEPLSTHPTIADGPTRGMGWADILAESTDREHFMSLVREQFPRDYVLNTDRLYAFADREWAVVVPPYVHNQEWTFNLPAGLDDWMQDEFVVDGISLFFSFLGRD